MEVSLYDKVLLTTGETAYIVEIYESTQAFTLLRLAERSW